MLTALISNIKAIAVNSRPGIRSTKNTFFDRTWGKNTAFQRNVGRGAFEVLQGDEKNHKAAINDEILVLFKTDLTADRSRFINKVASESLSFLQVQRAKLARKSVEEKIVTASMAAMVEQVFEILKAYAYEVNNAVGFGPLHLAATNPQQVTEIVRFDKNRQSEETITHFRARLSTSKCSLVIRGNKSGIEFFVMPVARAMGLSMQEKSFTPVGAMVCKLQGDRVEWETTAGMPMAAHHVETLCMELFQILMQLTKDQVVTDDPGYFYEEQAS